MSSLLTTLGLRALPATSPPNSVPNLASTFLIWNFLHAYAFMSTRFIKNYYKFDHNSAPREDVEKYGEKMVKDGKLTAGQLAMVKRWEAGHENCVEGYTLFVAGTLLALYAGVPTPTLNGLMAAYSVARMMYGVTYIAIETEQYSPLRTLCWWSGNIACLTMMVKAGNRL
ncbi:uncharacterized protein LY89DRAFT_683903 [Mollisia scopiformis]|uniref:Uncharacterized protein n=1 Tax=Mollisia scopiformis TaxID=149040 RepID=A0A194XCL5_MOLSC|nr:uncharacterized protein LY89DRAFT_683903 [Mollisia scopiformis]KUJ17918.1 hypothetical protein LY89DRAFT_683903 [Mollisia scopiformis]